ncbi:MAG: hypothetical protein ACR2FU_11315 [Streptosporangiaceae bacterium]
MSVIVPLGMAAVSAAAGLTGFASPALASSFLQVPCGTSLATVHPAANTTVELSKSCTYTTALTITASTVTVTSYGLGSAPVISRNSNGAAISLYGSHDTVKGLRLTGIAPATWTCGGKQTPAGHVDGVDIYSGATADTVTGVTATGFYAAVYIMTGASGNSVQNSALRNNIMLDTNNSSGSAGAFGVLLWGSGNTVSGNTISGNQACSIAYGRDGSAIEVYGGSNNTVSSNTATNDNAFTELGNYSGNVATGNSFTGNTVSDGTGGLGTTFLVTRGSGDSDGPVYNTTASNNTLSLTKSGDEGAVSYSWQQGDGTLLTLTGNYLNLGSNEVLYEDGGYVDGGGNTFIGWCNPSTDC